MRKKHSLVIMVTVMVVAATGALILNRWKPTIDTPTSHGDGIAEQKDMIGNLLVRSVYVDRVLAVKGKNEEASQDMVNALIANMQINLVRAEYLNAKGCFTRKVGEDIQVVVTSIQQDSSVMPELMVSQWPGEANGVVDLLPTEPVLPRFYPVGPEYLRIIKR